jgi:hypothetical protein
MVGGGDDDEEEQTPIMKPTMAQPERADSAPPEGPEDDEQGAGRKDRSSRMARSWEKRMELISKPESWGNDADAAELAATAEEIFKHVKSKLGPAAAAAGDGGKE